MFDLNVVTYLWDRLKMFIRLKKNIPYLKYVCGDWSNVCWCNEVKAQYIVGSRGIKRAWSFPTSWASLYYVCTCVEVLFHIWANSLWLLQVTQNEMAAILSCVHLWDLFLFFLQLICLSILQDHGVRDHNLTRISPLSCHGHISSCWCLTIAAPWRFCIKQEACLGSHCLLVQWMEVCSSGNSGLTGLTVKHFHCARVFTFWLLICGFTQQLCFTLWFQQVLTFCSKMMSQSRGLTESSTWPDFL